MYNKNDFNSIKLPSNRRMSALALLLMVIMSLVWPVEGISVLRNELGAFIGTACLLLLVNWRLKKDGLGFSQLLSESTEGKFNARMRRVFKLFLLYLAVFILAYYLIYSGFAVGESLSNGKLLKLSSLEIFTLNGKMQKNQHMLNLFHLAPLWWFFWLVCMAPFFEELFFRRFLYTAVRKKYGFAVSLTVTSGLFGLIHAPALLAVLATTMLGCFLGCLYEKQKDFCANVAFHALNNVFTLFIFWIMK
ncbi:MAG TPA: hypothetical protein DCL44_11120 [Elusimicrobia bacterium]|nr:hypothetical protein [Elusimicrobiota bacterium]